jgi:hypothetical protein
MRQVAPVPEHTRNTLESRDFVMAQKMDIRLLVPATPPIGRTNMNRLETIATAQKKTRVRDAIFACFVALAAVVAVTSVTTAAHAANVAQR